MPVSQLNRLRREVAAELEHAIREERTRRVERVLAEVRPAKSDDSSRLRSRLAIGDRFQWSIKVDRCAFLDAFESLDWTGVDEIIVDIARDPSAQLFAKLEQFAGIVGRERIRLALPALTRKWEEHGLGLKVQKLRHAGWDRWEAANLSAWSFLGLDPSGGDTHGLDLATDWSVYVLNRLVRQSQTSA